MSTAVRALRGATTVEVDSTEQISERVVELLRAMVAQNDVDHDDLISIWFTATGDLHSMFPAQAARTIGFGDVPLLCAQELAIAGSTPRCIRVLAHLKTTRSNRELHHVYLHGARTLRDDLPA
jgi:chorismate mutase